MQLKGIVSSNQTVELEGRGSLTVRPSDHVATGGEGSLYRPSPQTIIKFYSDQAKMMRDNMAGKIKLLSAIRHPYIVSPRGLAFINKKPVGFYMNFESGEPIARLFTSAYWQREKFTEKEASMLVEGMRATIMEAHKNHAILVDANEFNWLATRGVKTIEPRSIDVDSWAIGNWKASVIMPSIKDWHTQGFNDHSDWFSFAVVSFQVFTGIHPYKGMLTGYKPNEMERRMKDKKSVFAHGVRLNSAVRDFSLIPEPLRMWYRAVFDGSERNIPPSPKDTVVKAPQAGVVKRVAVTRGGAVLVFDLIWSGAQDMPVRIHPVGVIECTSGTLITISNGKTVGIKTKPLCEIIETECGLLIAECDPQNADIAFSVLDAHGVKKEVPTVLSGNSIFRAGNRLFITNETGITEITAKDYGKGPLIVPGTTWQVMGNSTTWFDGVGIQDTLGVPYFILPFEEKSCAYVAVKELKGLKVVDAISGMRYVVVSALEPKSGKYFKYEFVFDKTYNSYSLNQSELAMPDLNIVTLPKGVMVSVENDGELTIVVPTQGTVRNVTDSRIKTYHLLERHDNTVMFVDGAKVWSLRLK